MIIGPASSGKSTLARQLGEKLNLPVYHLDKLFWKPNWQMTSAEEKRKILSEIMSRENWIIDGNYRSTLLDERTQRADTIIFLDFPRMVIVPRWLKRVAKNWGKTRPDLGGNNIEHFSLDYLKMQLGREHRYKDHEGLKRAAEIKKLIVLKNSKQIAAFLARF